MKCCPLWRRFSTRSRAILLRQYGCRNAPSAHSLQRRTASQPALQEAPLLLILALFCQKWRCTLLDCIERALHLASDLPASSGPKRATLEDHVALCERGQQAGQQAT